MKNSNNWVYYIIGFVIALSMLTAIQADNDSHTERDKIHTIEVDTSPTPSDYLAKH